MDSGKYSYVCKWIYVYLNIVRFHCSTATYTAVFYIIILVMIFMSLFSVLYLLLKKKQISEFRPGSIIYRQ